MEAATPQKNVHSESVSKKQLPTVPKENKKTPIKLPEISKSLSQCKDNLFYLEASSFVNKSSWQSNRIKDLFIILESLIEIAEIKQFSIDLIFEQTDLLRRSVETLLEITTIFTKTTLEDVQLIGHDTKKLLNLLINKPEISKNIKKIIWNMRNVPLSLAEGNRCVNYPAEAYKRRKHMDNESRLLTDFLFQVDREENSQIKNEALRGSLIVQHHRFLQRGVYFLEKLLETLCDPSKEVEGELPLEHMQNTYENHLVNVEDAFSKEPISSQMISDETIDSELLPILFINNRKEALLALDKALIWTGIRCIAPVEGCNSLNFRTTERNIALQNVALYLRRLKEKLTIDRMNRPISTSLGQCGLLRRAQKELLIAALYHTNSFESGQHIIQARNIRFMNSPCILANILRKVSACATTLPSLGEWMHNAHKILSYPASNAEKDFSAIRLQELIIEVTEASKMMRRFSNDETLVLSNNKHISPAQRIQERIHLVETNEKDRIFPGIALLLYTLKHGLILPKHNQLNIATDFRSSVGGKK